MNNTVPFVTPYGIDPQDVPWLRDLITRNAVRLFDVRQLYDLTLSVAVGPFCSIHTAQLQLAPEDTPTFVAIKQYHRPAELTAEVHQLLIAPQSQYINPLLGIVQLGDHGLACLVVPYHPLGNLRRYIAEQRENLSALQQMQIIHDIVSGLEVLHQRGIHHMNLHSANILISMQGIAVLTDFGRANNRAEVGMPPKPTAEQERARSLAVVFLAPEVLASNSYSNRSEVYALGMVMYELLTGKVAFEKDLNQPGLSNRVMFGKQDEIPPNLKGSPGPAYEALIKECWKLNPGDRPHLLVIKSRLEQLMAETRRKAEAIKLQHQATQLQQQQLYQQQQAHYMESYQPGSIAPPTPPPQDVPQMNPTSIAQNISARLAANTAAQAAALKASEQTIITTKIIITEPIRPRTESLSSNTSSEKANTAKPIEAWTIGQATTNSASQQRDAIPISTRALEITSGQLKNRTALSTDQLFSMPLKSTSASESSPAQGTTTATIAQKTGSESLVGPSPAQNLSVTTSTPSVPIASNDNSRSSMNFVWPLPPNVNHNIQPSTSVSNVNTQSTPGGQTGPSTNIPAQNLSASGTSYTPTSFYKPPPKPSVATNNDTKQANTSFSQGSPITTTDNSADNRPTVLSMFESMAGSRSSQQGGLTQISPTSSRSMSPDSLFNPGRYTIFATSAAEQQQQHEPLTTFFNMSQQPQMPPGNGEERRSINSASSQVKVVEENANVNGVYNPSVSNQEQRYERVKSFVATIEPIGEVAPITPVVHMQYQTQLPTQQQTQLPTQQQTQLPTQQQTQLPIQQQTQLPTQQQTQEQPHPQPSTTVANGKQLRESILIIPAFPEPPSTLHDRRISNVDPRYRQAARLARTQLSGKDQGSASSDDTKNRNSGWTGAGAVTAPQEAGSGASPVTTALASRDSYTPITSSEDVPTGTPSDCIFSAARNGDLIELQQFLNQSLSRSISGGSSISMGSGSRKSGRRVNNPAMAEILDELAPIELLPVLCCAAVARKNKYQALNMVLKAGANVEGKEMRGGNTALHLVCETAPPPLMEPKLVRYKQDEHGNRIRAESSVDLTDNKMSQLTLSDVGSRIEGVDSISGDEEFYDDDDDDSEEKQADALKKVDEQDEQEQQALERVQEDSESIYSISTTEGGFQSLSIRNQTPLGGPYYQIKNYILMKGGLEDQIRLLVLAGSPIDAPNQRGETPLLLLLRHQDSVTALATLVKLGANPTLMAPFGPGTNPPEIHVDPLSIVSPKDQKRASKALKAMEKSAPKLNSVYLQQLPPSPNNDPNHILIMHGDALAHAAYYLRINCLRYLLEHEIECSHPVAIDRAIVACQQSEAARVNPSLVATQRRILQILERDWKGEAGHRRRARIAERTLNLKMKPERPSVLLEALNVATTPSSTSTASISSANREGYLSPPPTPTQNPTNYTSSKGKGNRRSTNTAKAAASATLTLIPTTHLYAIDGPSGTEIELISQRGFQVDPLTSQVQSLTVGSSNGMALPATIGGGIGSEQIYSTDFQDWRASAELQSMRLGQIADPKGIFSKIRNMTKRS
ncbi:hypothetical protein BGZ46_010517 [Entomortierella lignicola]|nr:hypothetical protein BGZ46_010517 [Entomortierella lignicola]